jgi:hypothetical protein
MIYTRAHRDHAASPNLTGFAASALPAPRVEKLIANGTIHPKMQRKDALALLPRPKAPIEGPTSIHLEASFAPQSPCTACLRP